MDRDRVVEPASDPVGCQVVDEVVTSFGDAHRVLVVACVARSFTLGKATVWIAAS